MKNISRLHMNTETRILSFKTSFTKKMSLKITKTIIAFLLSITLVNAQAVSGGWDAAGVTSTVANTGYINHGNGVIQLMNTNNTFGCQGSYVAESSSTYDPTSGTDFNKCYQVFFGCPDNDDIGSDQKGDGMAFSFYKGAYNITNGNACGGGLGYMGASAKMITIEFDTWSSQGNAGFDATYGGGTTGNNDELSIHQNGDASDGGRLTGAGATVNAGNLEDGLEHAVCINYNRTTHVLSVTIDGVSKLSYDLDLSGVDLTTYFGAGGINQAWSSGKFGATNPSTVSDGANIAANIGGAPLCPANIVITSPSTGAAVGTCNGPVTITASSTAPANNTISYVEFFVDAVSIGVDNSAAYNITWDNPTVGNHALTAVAHFVPSNTTSTSSVVNISVSTGLQKTATAPVIDGAVDLIWGNYPSTPISKLVIGTITGAADLSASYKMMRDATKLYILVDVTDNILVQDGTLPWEDDGIEVFIDMGNNKPNTFGANDFQYAFDYGTVAATASEYYHSPASLTGVMVSQSIKAGGYFMEISIPWTTLGGVPSNGDMIGFDIGVNDDDNGGTRDSKIQWFDGTDNDFHDPSYFGTVEVASCDPCPTGVLTGTNFVCNENSSSILTVDFTGNNPWSFTYSKDGTTQPALTGITTTPYTFQSSAGAHTYALVSVSNALTAGCTGNATGTAVISINTNIPVGHNGTFTSPGSATLSVDNNGGTYQWFDAPAGGNLVFTGSVFVTPVLANKTTYYVQEASAAPCRIEVEANPIPNLGVFFIPNLITPNGDGKNDTFEVSALPANSSLKVFNRWGNLLYQSNNYDNLWTGDNAVDGVYYYELILPTASTYKGWLHIVR